MVSSCAMADGLSHLLRRIVRHSTILRNSPTVLKGTKTRRPRSRPWTRSYLSALEGWRRGPFVGIEPGRYRQYHKGRSRWLGHRYTRPHSRPTTDRILPFHTD